MEMGRKQRRITTESSGGRRESLGDLRVQSGFVVQSGAAVLLSPTLASGEQPQPRLISSTHEGQNQKQNSSEPTLWRQNCVESSHQWQG